MSSSNNFRVKLLQVSFKDTITSLFLFGRVLEVLAGIAQGREAIDEDRMSTIIKRQILNIHNQVSLFE